MMRLLIIIGATWLAFQWWKGHAPFENHRTNKNGETHLSRGENQRQNGFIDVVMPDGATANTVLIFAPINCPSDAAQRADDLADKLTRLGIPNMRSSSFSSTVNNPTKEQQEGIERAVSVINGEIPAVFINGVAKANPTVDEVVSEFERTR